MAELLDCPVCLETYNDPQILISCGHTFCRRCIDDLHPKRCPNCREAFTANGFRPNFALRMMLEDMTAGSPTNIHGNDPEANGYASTVPSAPPAQASDAYAVTRRGTCSSPAGDSPDDDPIIVNLTEVGLSYGLAKLLREEDKQIALRIFLLDNSGSTSSPDGNRLLDSHMVNCTRWEETRHMAVQQARWNARIGTPCEFVLLNSPMGASASGLREGIDFMRIDPLLGDTQKECDKLEHMLQNIQPNGPTPLTRRISEIYERIQRELAELVQNRQQVILIIATDGMPTTPNRGCSNDSDKTQFVQALRRIASNLPVHIVIRLTTDEDDVIEFYNKIDEELEIPLEVLDDIKSEAKEVASKGNGWLTYSPFIHMLREQGTFVKLFDLLDERCLTPLEAMTLARLMLQTEHAASLPRGPEDFCRYAKERLQNMPPVYDPILGRMGPCIRVPALYSALVPLSQRLTACCQKRRRRSQIPQIRYPWQMLTSSVRDSFEFLTRPSFTDVR